MFAAGARHQQQGRPSAGDILLIRFSGDPQHLAIFTGETIIHSYASVGAVCEHRMADVWAARIVCAYRFKGLA
ncbi:hypothetical protein [Propionivibrio sp.]|uniref:hypothetical protein n=1 Tax=Propionivibrio sp. TaxID=2212460 RepID=UPI0025EC4D18|nr:hypothetical protein [Propionivibrio sp.]MBK7357516.1 hypothetical protein [Propionivibrio sp.]